MLASIDAGSNTLRLLIGKVVAGKVVPELYLRRICRLAGDFSKEEGLAAAARERTLVAFKEMSEVCQDFAVEHIRAVGTAAFRQAVNGEDFARDIRVATRIPLEVISGESEAACMTEGVLSALDPLPSQSLIIDIGGGSTEFVLCLNQKVVWSRSIPMGVVRLTEDYPAPQVRHRAIEGALTELVAELIKVCNTSKVDFTALTLVGTAGSVTTLAALDLQMTDYDWQRVNNYSLSLLRLQYWQAQLTPLSPVEREALPGMEEGRGDLIVAGLEIILGLMHQMKCECLVVSDFGILEGLLLSMGSGDL